VLEEADRMQAIIAAHADIVLADFESRQDLSSVEADIAIVLGGDGSILRAAKQMGSNQIPVLGVNLGRLGFLADVSPEELVHRLPEIVAGDCSVVDHLMFQCSIILGDEPADEQLGLNETAIMGGLPFSMLDINLYVDSDLVTTYSCDGLIISTPVGSTAHSLSAGGPILRKNLQAFVISPISPHTLTMRPVVDTADRVYEMVVSRSHENTMAVVDGVPICPLTPEHRVRVQRAQPKFKMVEVRGRNYYRTLREKLGWGSDFRNSAK
jgi:NAD+ kinase